MTSWASFTKKSCCTGLISVTVCSAVVVFVVFLRYPANCVHSNCSCCSHCEAASNCLLESLWNGQTWCLGFLAH